MPQSLTTLQSTALGPVLTVSGVSPTVAVTTTAYPGSATAADPAGDETLTITGTGFNAGVKVYVGSTICTTTYVSATSLTFVTPANSVGSYVLYVYNTDGTNGASPAGITYSAIPVWVTAGGALPGGSTSAPYSTTVVATGDSIVYSVTTGSLPTGLSLNASTGAITGTSTVAATSTFSITATDAQNQGVARSFSITITAVVSEVEYLVVAGGGGGGANIGGGGGAGGLRTATGLAVSPGVPITVTVGAGGVAGVTGGVAFQGGLGVDSVFGSITSLGGGGGGYAAVSAQNGTAGGSGGGAGSLIDTATNDATGGAGTANQGFRGGNVTNSARGAGGGGGASAAGGDTGSDVNGAGGAGLASSISGTSTTYAGGGGAGGYPNNGGAGGAGGGGAGANPTNGTGTAGTANTGGGGGGGGGGVAPGGQGAAGGSGIVIIRYSDAFPAATSTTGSPTITVSGGYRVYVWTASGSITF